MSINWLEIIKIIGPDFREWTTSSSVKKAIKEYLKAQTGSSLFGFSIESQDVKTILIQLEALDMLEVENLKTIKGNMNIFYKLKPIGFKIMMRENVILR
mgnify:CR=1 FL=1